MYYPCFLDVKMKTQRTYVVVLRFVVLRGSALNWLQVHVHIPSMLCWVLGLHNPSILHYLSSNTSVKCLFLQHTQKGTVNVCLHTQKGIVNVGLA